MPTPFTPLSFDVKHPAIRSPREEWKPHARMSAKSYEWWYMTMIAYDTSGHRYFLFFDLVNYTGEGYQKRFGYEPVPGHRLVHLVGRVTDYDRDDYRTFHDMAPLADADLWQDEGSAVFADTGRSRARWAYEAHGMELQAEFANARLDLRFADTDEVLWHQDKLGIEGLIQQGAEDDFSFYYSIVRAPAFGELGLKSADGSWRMLKITGSAWIDRQWGDFDTAAWEWSSFRFDNGARLHLYNFYNGHQEGLYITSAGEIHRFDGVAVKQNGYARAPEVGTWVSWGWSYQFPIEIEGSNDYRVEPFSPREFLEVPELGYALYEGGGRLIDESTGTQVGLSVNESADIRIMRNGPYEGA